MKEIHSSQDVVELRFLQEELRKQGIATEIKNPENSSTFSLKGGLPLASNLLPSLWVIDDERSEEAKEISDRTLEAFASASGSKRGWLCSQCQETNPESLGVCWKCGATATENWVPYQENPSLSNNGEIPAKNSQSRRPYLLLLLFLAAGFAGGYYASRYLHQKPKAFDNNMDGKSDEWIIQSKRSKLPMIFRDTNFDGKADIAITLDSSGHRKLEMADTNFDGVYDVIYFFKDNLTSWSEAFPKGIGGPGKGSYDPDQKPTVVKHYYNGVLLEEWVDDNEDGAMDRKITFDYLGKVKNEEKIAEDNSDWKRQLEEDQEKPKPTTDFAKDPVPEIPEPPPKNPLQF